LLNTIHQKSPILTDRFLAQVSPERPEDFIDLEKLAAIGLRRAWVIALCAGLGLLLGILYLLFTPSKFTATTSILLDNNLAKYSADTQTPTPPMEMDAFVLSEVEIMKSERLARTVVSAEKLDQDEAFLNPPQSPVGWAKGEIRGLIASIFPKKPTGHGTSAGEAKILRAVQILQANLDAERVDRSFVINLSYQSNDPQLSGRITRASPP